MIELTPNKDGLFVDQWCVPPTIYLDHWAWRKISESEQLANRFSTALKSNGGTLAFSWLNLFEFSRVSDEQQTREADMLLNAVLPQAFIIDPDFYKVCSKEDKIQTSGECVAPHADIVSLKFFAKYNLTKSTSLKVFPAQNLFRLTPATGIAGKYDGFTDLIIKRIESLRRDYDDNRDFRLRVDRLPRGRPNQYGTRVIASELLGSFLKNKKIRVSRNHAIDVSHAVVAVAYCDYVLLDSHWATQVEQARKRISDGGLSFPMAKVFSEKRLEEFFAEFESGGRRIIS